MFINEDQKNKLKKNIDYILFYKKYIPELKQCGSIFVCLCPFHNEKTPSFSIDIETGLWKCWGKCQLNGDVIDFYKKINNKNFASSVLEIAELCNINIEISEEAQKEFNKKRELNCLTKEINLFYRKGLKQNKEALRYLVEDRKLSFETINKFKLGSTYPKHNYSSLSFSFNKQTEDLKLLNYVVEKDDKKYDYFYGNRIIIPYFNLNNNVSGFNSRVIEKDINPKYFKSKSSVLFDASKELFGINHAIEEITKYRSVILVEGEFDVMRGHQNDINNVVGISGLSLSEYQIKTLSKPAKQFFIIVEDNKTEERLKDLYNNIILHAPFTKVRIVNLYKDLNTNKMDLDEYLLKYSKDLFYKKIKESKVYNLYIIDKILEESNYSTIEEKKKYVYLLREHLLNIKNNIDKKQYIELVANKLDLPENDIYRIIKTKEKQEELKEIVVKTVKGSRIDTAQKMIIAILFCTFDKNKIINLMENNKIENYLNIYYINIYLQIKKKILLNYNNSDIMIEIHNEFNEDKTRDLINDIYFKSKELNDLSFERLEEFLKDQIYCLK